MIVLVFILYEETVLKPNTIMTAIESYDWKPKIKKIRNFVWQTERWS